MQLAAISGADERIAISALCLQTPTLQAIAPGFPESPFASRWANLVAFWCLKHYNAHNEAPGPAGITALYADWASTADKDTAAIIGRFLGSLDANAVPNTGYSVELIRKLILKTSIKNLSDKLSGALSNGKLEEALALAEGWGRPQVAEALEGVFLTESPEAITQAMNAVQAKPLIRFPEGSPIAKFFGPTLCRDALVAFWGADKSGKSVHLMSLAIRAMMQGNRTVFCGLGDLSHNQTIRRLTTYLVGKPSLMGEYKTPVSLVYKDKEPLLKFEEHCCTSPYTEQDGIEAWHRAGKDDPKRFRVISKSANTFSVKELRSQLQTWADREGWVPSVIVLDYAELLARHPNSKDAVESTDLNWMEMRAISTDFNCLLLTASQCNASGYGSWLLGRESFSGSKAKAAHANSVIGINMTDHEKDNQVCRMNYIVCRESEFLTQIESRIIGVAGTPITGRFHQISCFI
jgi:hypothetical protein